MYRLIPHSWGLWTISREIDVVTCSQDGTSGYDTTVIRIQTVADSRFLDVLIPSVQEISVEAVSSSIAIGKDKLPSHRLIYTVGPVENFKKQSWNRNGMTGWTRAIVDARDIRNVRGVRQIEVLTIPAGLEIDLCAHAVDAVGVEHVVLFWNSVSLVYAAETYPVGNWPSVLIRQGRRVV